MPSSADEILDLKNSVERLSAEVASLERRLAALEAGTARAYAFPLATSVSAERDGAEARFGLTIINRIGAITLAVGLIFFLKYAADNNWIGTGGLVLSGVLLGLVMIGAADWLRRRNQRIFSQGVAGCGLATLYVTLYAAFSYYKLTGGAVTMIALLAVCTLALFLSFRFESQATAALGFIGGLLAPLLLQAGHPQKWFALQCLYLVVVDLCAIAVAAIEGWRIIVPLIGASTIIVALIAFESSHPYWFVSLTLALAVGHFISLSWKRRAEFDGYTYLTGHGYVVLAGLRLIGVWADYGALPGSRASFISEMTSVYLALYGITMIAYGIARRSVVDRLLGLVLLGIVVFKLYLYDIWLLTRGYRISAFVGLGVLLLAASYFYSRFKAQGGVKQQ